MIMKANKILILCAGIAVAVAVCQVPNFLDSMSLSFFTRCHFENWM